VLLLSMTEHCVLWHRHGRPLPLLGASSGLLCVCPWRAYLHRLMKVDYIVFCQVKKGRGRPRKTLVEVLKRDLKGNNIYEDLVFNQAK